MLVESDCQRARCQTQWIVWRSSSRISKEYGRGRRNLGAGFAVASELPPYQASDLGDRAASAEDWKHADIFRRNLRGRDDVVRACLAGGASRSPDFGKPGRTGRPVSRPVRKGSRFRRTRRHRWPLSFRLYAGAEHGAARAHLRGFHAARSKDRRGRMYAEPEASALVLQTYPSGVRSWIKQRGGLTSHLLLLRGRELAAFYPTCR
jgi:hypothetical protein